MTNLTELQRDFQDYILNGGERFLTEVAGDGVDFVKQRSDIYANMYVLRLQEAVENDFPLLQHVLGDVAFTKLTLDYIQRHPSHRFTLRYYSEGILDYVEKYSPYADNPLLAEIVRFEWASISLVDAPDGDIKSIEDLQAVPADEWGGLQFGFHPSLQTLSLRWNVHELWIAHDQGERLPAPEQYEESILHILWRNGVEPYHDMYNALEAKMLLWAIEKQTFADICENLCQYLPEEQVAEFAVGQIAGWLGQGIVSDITT